MSLWQYTNAMLDHATKICQPTKWLPLQKHGKDQEVNVKGILKLHTMEVQYLLRGTGNELLIKMKTEWINELWSSRDGVLKKLQQMFKYFLLENSQTSAFYLMIDFLHQKFPRQRNIKDSSSISCFYAGLKPKLSMLLIQNWASGIVQEKAFSYIVIDHTGPQLWGLNSLT